MPRQVVKLAPEELPHERDGRLGVLPLQLGVHLLFGGVFRVFVCGGVGVWSVG